MKNNFIYKKLVTFFTFFFTSLLLISSIKVNKTIIDREKDYILYYYSINKTYYLKLNYKYFTKLIYSSKNPILFSKIHLSNNSKILISIIEEFDSNPILKILNYRENVLAELPSIFKFISSEQQMLNVNGKDYLFFRAMLKNKENEDIFLCDTATGSIYNITASEENEKNFFVNLSNDTIFLKTETIKYSYVYKISFLNSVKVELVSKAINRWNSPLPPRKMNVRLSKREYNTFLAFGDSITWGKMRMLDLEGEYHPELTFWAKIRDYFNENYGETYAVNLGVPGESSYMGMIRMNRDFTQNKGKYCYIMFGTNDVTNLHFSAESSAENIEWMVLNAIENFNMIPILFTIPPQKHFEPHVQYYKKQTEELNQRIKKIAKEYKIPFVDTYTAFFTQCPGGWEACLEDVKGNHPSPLGHSLIAKLTIPEILKLPPKIPRNLKIDVRGRIVNVIFDKNLEFDFSHYIIKLGLSSDKLSREFFTQHNFFSLYLFDPFMFFVRRVYFKIASVDKDGNKSKFTRVYQINF